MPFVKQVHQRKSSEVHPRHSILNDCTSYFARLWQKLYLPLRCKQSLRVTEKAADQICKHSCIFTVAHFNCVAILGHYQHPRSGVPYSVLNHRDSDAHEISNSSGHRSKRGQAEGDLFCFLDGHVQLGIHQSFGEAPKLQGRPIEHFELSRSRGAPVCINLPLTLQIDANEGGAGTNRGEDASDQRLIFVHPIHGEEIRQVSHVHLNKAGEWLSNPTLGPFSPHHEIGEEKHERSKHNNRPPVITPALHRVPHV